MPAKRTTATILICFFSTHAFAWGWKDAVDQAMQKNPSLKSLEETAQAAQLRSDNVYSLHYPTINLVGGYQEFQDQTRKFRHRAFLGPRLQLPLFQGGRIGYGADRAEAVARQADLGVEVNSVNINSKLREAYARALYSKNYVDLAHRIEERRFNNLKLIKIRYESGLEYRWVSLNTETKWKQAQLDSLQADMNSKTSLAEIENLLGPLPIKTTTEMTDADFYATDTEYNLDYELPKIEKNPKYRTAQMKIDEAEANIRFNSAERYPALALQADAWAGNTEQEQLFPWWTVGIALSMPIFRGGQINRNVGIARSQLSQAKFDAFQTQLDLKTTLQKTYQTYIIAKKQVEVSQSNVEASKDRAKVVANQYRSGLTTFLDWDTSQDNWVSAEIDLLSKIRDYQISRARFEEAMGVELSHL